MNGININDQISKAVYDSLFDLLYKSVKTSLDNKLRNSVSSLIWNRLDDPDSVDELVNSELANYAWRWG